MRNKLIYKFILIYVVTTLTAYLAISLLIPNLTEKKFITYKSDEIYRQASVLANYYSNSTETSFDNSSDISHISNLTAHLLDCDVLFCTSSGLVLLNTSSNEIDQIENFDPAANNSNKYHLDDFFGAFDQKRLTVFYPVHRNFVTSRYFVLSYHYEQIKSNVNAFCGTAFLAFGITAILLGTLIILFVKKISLPLGKLIHATTEYSKGVFSERTKTNRNDEIGRLSSSLNYMAEKLNDSNDYQKKFIANISHDFRSPLTSIKGYLEAIADGTIPHEMQGKYINIILTETERLTKLTNNLLTMNNMDNNGQALDLSEFDIISTIKRVIETFEGLCEKKGIKFKLVLSDKKLFVHADYSKIQQVIYNLVDNAIKFSHHDSSIIISVNSKSDKVVTSIKDFGLGIPKDSQSKIWDRFYKTDLSRGKDKKGTGLGLSIVKEIIKAHNEHIDLISTEGVGSEFIFTLPRVDIDE